jgi:anti-sigma-K factor RskA
MNGGESNMRSERVDEILLAKYLLGNLTEDEQVRVEDRAFADPDYQGALESAEADLIDAYVRGELGESDRRGFERRFLISASRRTKVEFAKAFAKVAAESKPAESAAGRQRSGLETLVSAFRHWNPAFQFAMAFATLICVAGASWLIVENKAMHSQVAVLEAQRRNLEIREQGLRRQRQLSEEQSHAGSLTAQLLQRPSPNATQVPSFASLILLPGLSRAETRVEQLVLSPSVQLARIEIQLEARDDYRRFRAELHTRSGEELLSRSNLTKHRNAGSYSVVFDVPASVLAAGDYELALKGILNDQSVQDVGYYYFSVLKH